MTHNEMRANADKLAELCRVLEGYSHELHDASEAGQMLRRYLPKIEALSGQLSFDMKNLTAENRQLSERLRLFTEEQDRRARQAFASKPFAS